LRLLSIRNAITIYSRREKGLFAPRKDPDGKPKNAEKTTKSRFSDGTSRWNRDTIVARRLENANIRLSFVMRGHPCFDETI
jgi:hypothetical protein